MFSEVALVVSVIRLLLEFRKLLKELKEWLAKRLPPHQAPPVLAPSF